MKWKDVIERLERSVGNEYEKKSTLITDIEIAFFGYEFKGARQLCINVDEEQHGYWKVYINHELSPVATILFENNKNKLIVTAIR